LLSSNAPAGDSEVSGGHGTAAGWLDNP